MITSSVQWIGTHRRVEEHNLIDLTVSVEDQKKIIVLHFGSQIRGFKS